MPLGKKDGDRRMRAESPELDPMGDAGSEAEDLLLSFDYRREDRDSVFDGLRQRLDLVAVMITVIIAGVIGYVGVQIMQNTRDSTGVQEPYDTNTSDGVTTPAPGTGGEFYDAQTNFTGGLEDFFGNIGTVFVVIVLVVIIGYLMLLRGR